MASNSRYFGSHRRVKLAVNPARTSLALGAPKVASIISQALKQQVPNDLNKASPTLRDPSIQISAYVEVEELIVYTWDLRLMI